MSSMASPPLHPPSPPSSSPSASASASQPSSSTSTDPTPTTNATAGPSNRNASNAHLPMPEMPSGAATEPLPDTPVGPVKPVNMASGSKRSIVVNACQRGNPILKAIQGIGWEYGDIVPDYQVGANTCVLFLSLKYHRLHPEYLHNRIERLRGMYLLRILLLMCDINEHQEPIREITKICLINEITVMTAWSNEEAATYLATYKAFEHKPPDLLKERFQNDYASRLHGVLTSVRGVNKTDVMTLSTNFGSFKNLAHATPEQLSLCPGLGDVKVRRLVDAFNTPFKVSAGTPIPRPKSSKSTSKAKLKEGEAALPPGQLSLRESVERGRSVTATPEMATTVIDVDAEDATLVIQGSPDWPVEENTSADADDGGNDGSKKRVWHDPLDSDDDDDDGEGELEGGSLTSRNRQSEEDI